MKNLTFYFLLILGLQRQFGKKDVQMQKATQRTFVHKPTDRKPQKNIHSLFFPGVSSLSVAELFFHVLKADGDEQCCVGRAVRGIWHGTMSVRV